MPVVITADEMNRRNKAFWDCENKLMQERLQKPEILTVAVRDLESEAWRQVPIRNRKTFESALQDAEEVAAILVGPSFQASMQNAARKAGSAPKSDALALLIREIVRAQPDISLAELISKLDGQREPGIIQDLEDGGIWFANGPNDSKHAPVSGLKDRLSRAKKEIRLARSR
jgi:hypothetical protein